MVYDLIILYIDIFFKVKYDKICMFILNVEIYFGKKYDILKIDVSFFMCVFG